MNDSAAAQETTPAETDAEATTASASEHSQSEHSHGYSGDKARLLARLSRIEGQVRGVARMIEDDKYCIDVLTQISATGSGLENVALVLLEDHLAHCVVDAARSGSQAEAEQKVAEAAEAIKRLVKS